MKEYLSKGIIVNTTETNLILESPEFGPILDPDSGDLSIYNPQISSEERVALHGYLSYLSHEADYEQLDTEQLDALTSVLSEGLTNEDDPQYQLKIGILQAFEDVKLGREVSESNLVLAGLWMIVSSHKIDSFNPTRDVARARAFVNTVRQKEASSTGALYERLTRIAGLITADA